ncbi:MAG: transcription antitermination factor NusB [Proteobacteria bacterium]|nr:transcription antitermination factor NusB [Pseudomonadota bacterium]
MGTRRQSRESALKVLYQIELTGQSPADAVASYFDEHDSQQGAREFAEFLVSGVVAGREALDEAISGHSTNWKISRMAAVDKNILRMAVFELMSCPDIPAKVTINEAVEIAKKYGSAESGAFVNGILDNVAKGIQKPDSAESDG